MSAAIVVVEDDLDIAEMIMGSLTRAGHELTYVDTGAAAIETISRDTPDLVLLDLGLPDIDGLTVCQRVRDAGYTGGIIVVTARTSPEDVTAARAAGADDFVAKPFGLAELRARVTEVLRRHDPRPAARLTTPSGLTLDTATRDAHVGSTLLPLTDTEFDALALLATEPGQPVPTEQLVTRLWGEDTRARHRALDLTLKQLQRKLEAAGVPDRVSRGTGTIALETPGG